MNAQVICNLDDAAKLFIVKFYSNNVQNIDDQQIDRFFKNAPISNILLEDQLKAIHKKYFNHRNIEETLLALLVTARNAKLCYHFSIPYEKWLGNYFRLYLRFFHRESMVTLTNCNKYSRDNYKGVKVIANKYIEKNQILKNIFGYYYELNSEEEQILVGQNKDFSLLTNLRSNRQNIFLGTVAFLNHDCENNCEYVSAEKHMVYLRTIRKLEIGEELLVYYGDDYFGPNNEDCECRTCDLKKKDLINNTNSTDSTVVDDEIQNVVVDTTDMPNHLCTGSDYEMLPLPLYMPISTSITKIFGLNVTCMNLVRLHCICSNKNIRLNASSQIDVRMYKSISNSYTVQYVDNRITLEMEVKCESLSLDIIQLSLLAQMLSEDCISNFYFATPHIQAVDFYPNDEKDLCGFSKHAQLDKKLDVALVKLERLDPNIHELFKKKPKNGFTFCIFCGISKPQFRRHLRSAHKNEEIVEQFCNDSNEEWKNAAIDFLRHQGLARYEELTGIRIPVAQAKMDALQQVEKVRCNNCGAHFSKKTLWCHYRKCVQFAPFKIKNK